MDREVLSGLNERKEVIITIAMQYPDTEEKIYKQAWPMGLLPFDHWLGAHILSDQFRWI